MERKSSYKILVISDSHGHNNMVRYAIGQEAPFDMLIHCGDAQCDLNDILGEQRDYEIRVVKGNCDWISAAPKNLNFKVGYYNIFVTHGDLYGVKYSYDVLLNAARRNHADVVLFGHSHVPEVERTEDNILLVNPGSCALPHQYPPRKTYAVLTISEDDLPEAEIRTLPDYVPENW